MAHLLQSPATALFCGSYFSYYEYQVVSASKHSCWGSYQAQQMIFRNKRTSNGDTSQFVKQTISLVAEAAYVMNLLIFWSLLDIS